MWLRNFYNMLTAAFLADDDLTSTATPSDYTPPIKLRLPGGTYTSTNISASGNTNDTNGAGINGLLAGKARMTLSNSYSPNGVNYHGTCIVLGSGTTPVTYDDYRIETPLSGLTLVNGGGTATTPTTLEGNKIKSERSYTITNSSAEDKTVAEVALYTSYNDNTALTTPGAGVCIYREVLAEPVTLHPSESIIIGFKREATIYNYTPYT